MSTQNLNDFQKAVDRANLELEEAVRRLAPKHVGGEMEAYEAAFQSLMRAERELAAAQGQAYAVLEDFPLVWDIGAPLPTLLQTDSEAVLFFLLADYDQGVGIVRFQSCFSVSLGGPGDETFEGHPLHGKGFEAYKPMRVVNSPWIDQLRKIDSVHSQHNPEVYRSLKHLIFPFHDTTFECVVRSYSTSVEQGTLSDAVRRAVDHLY